MRAFISALALISTSLAVAAPLPHVVIILADDLGWHAPGFREPSLLTPALDAMRAESIELSGAYAYMYCSPTRASLLTGRYPYKTESTRNNLIPFDQEDGVNLNFTMLPAKLKLASTPYATHGIGKWHLGFWKKEYTPTMRGFDTWDGFLAGGQDHFTQKSFGECGCAQNDIWVNGTIDPGLHGEYNAQRFTAAAVARIRNHDPATPLFLYVALQNVHAPLEADAAAMALYPDETYTLRRTFSAMMSTIDSSVANITAALRAAGVDASDGDIAPVDGLDAWPWLSGAAPASPRTRIVHEHSMFAPGNATGALRDGDWKLIVNTEPWAGWYGEKSSGHFTPPRSGPTTNVQACSPTAPCLFNVAVDPEERLDVASSNPSKVEELLAIFRSYDISYHPPRTAPVRNSKACCAMGQYLQPWG